LYQESHYEDLSIELFEIEWRKKQIYRTVNSLKELSQLDENLQEELNQLLNREKRILSDLLRAVSHSEIELQAMATVPKK
jgi:flagellar hook-basal body complex protein FliE